MTDATTEQARPQLGDIVTYEPEKTPNLQPEMSYLGRRWIVTQVGTHQRDDGHVRASALSLAPADSPTSIARHARNWRVLETAAYSRVREPLPTVAGAVIWAAVDGRAARILMLSTAGRWVDEHGAPWGAVDIETDGPDFDVVSLPRPEALRGAAATNGTGE